MSFSIVTELFATIPSYQNSTVNVYRDAKVTDGVSEQRFYYTPLFSLVSDESKQPTVIVDGTTVEVLFQCFTQQLHNLVLNEVKARINDDKLRNSQIGLIPIIGIQIKPESEDVGFYIYPNTGLALIPLSEQHEAKFKFSDVAAANKFAERVKNKNEDFYIVLTIPSVNITDDVISISASDFKRVDWKNFVNDKNADENIDANNQYFTIDQI
ncbi:hypothetical protein [Nostoc sp.]|uniref:hypothetical protein n=1 Tax=Nostoc sp. TaxID=1180 RepID=UPI002FF594FC